MKKTAKGTMKDMLLASSFLPVFCREKIGGKVYLDGGTVNNVPIDVLTDRGYRDVIVIRIYGIGLDREKNFEVPEGVTVHHIAPRRNLGGVLGFDRKRARRNLVLGYYDGLRFLYGPYGRKYYIDLPYSEAYYFDKLMAELELLKVHLERYAAAEELEKLSGYRAYTEKVFPALAKKFRLPAHWDYRDFYGVLLEFSAGKMGLDVFRVYEADEIVHQIHKRLKSL